jgi:hypothetical protein
VLNSPGEVDLMLEQWSYRLSQGAGALALAALALLCVALLMGFIWRLHVLHRCMDGSRIRHSSNASSR